MPCTGTSKTWPERCATRRKHSNTSSSVQERSGILRHGGNHTTPGSHYPPNGWPHHTIHPLGSLPQATIPIPQPGRERESSFFFPRCSVQKDVWQQQQKRWRACTSTNSSSSSKWEGTGPGVTMVPRSCQRAEVNRVSRPGPAPPGEAMVQPPTGPGSPLVFPTREATPSRSRSSRCRRSRRPTGCAGLARDAGTAPSTAPSSTHPHCPKVCRVCPPKPHVGKERERE